MINPLNNSNYLLPIHNHNYLFVHKEQCAQVMGSVRAISSSQVASLQGEYE